MWFVRGLICRDNILFAFYETGRKLIKLLNIIKHRETWSYKYGLILIKKRSHLTRDEKETCVQACAILTWGASQNNSMLKYCK